MNIHFAPNTLYYGDCLRVGREILCAAGKSRSTLPSNKWFPSDKQKRDLSDEKNAYDKEDRSRSKRSKK